jgi:hypothetical protein
MSLGDWFRRLFSPGPAPNAAGAEDEATLREEYGEDALQQPAPGGVVGGVSGLAGLEDAQAAEEAVEADDPPRGSAP